MVNNRDNSENSEKLWKIVNNETAMMSCEIQRNTMKCSEMQRNAENCTRNVDKCREVKRNV